jgi:hypothetical protein
MEEMQTINKFDSVLSSGRYVPGERLRYEAFIKADSWQLLVCKPAFYRN